jgi:SWI/SNF-related matrix-associated actin-dependent regulator of chromatin subfamily A member 5
MGLDPRCPCAHLGCLLANTGKTLQSISMLAFLHHFKGITGPHLVIVPKSTLGNWCKEFARWYPQFRVLKFYGNKEER